MQKNRLIYLLFAGIFLWCSQVIATPKDVAILGWGSLIPNPGDLGNYGQFKQGGPILPVAFTRVSQDGRMTLVVDPKSDSAGRKPTKNDYPGADVQTYYLPIKDNADLNFDEIIGILRKREGTKSDYIDYVNRISKKFRINQISPFTGEQLTVRGTYSVVNGQIDIDAGGSLRRELTPYLKGIITWMYQKDLKGVVWTGLQRNFAQKTEQPYSLANAKTYLSSLDPTQKEDARDYIQNAPVKTPHGDILLAYLQEQLRNVRDNNLNQVLIPDNQPVPYVDQSKFSEEDRDILAQAKKQGKVGNESYITKRFSDIHHAAQSRVILFIQDGGKEKVLKVYAEPQFDTHTPKDKEFIQKLNLWAQMAGLEIPNLIITDISLNIQIRERNRVKILPAAIQEKAIGKNFKDVIINDIEKMSNNMIRQMFVFIGKQYGALDKILTIHNRKLLYHNDDKADNYVYDIQTGKFNWIDIDNIAEFDLSGNGVHENSRGFSAPESWNAIVEIGFTRRPRLIYVDEPHSGWLYPAYKAMIKFGDLFNEISDETFRQLTRIINDPIQGQKNRVQLEKFIQELHRLYAIADGYLEGYLQSYPENHENIERFKLNSGFYKRYNTIPKLLEILHDGGRSVRYHQ